MKSFRTELEDPIVEKDILDLEKKIRLFKEGKIDSEKFRSLRLARGVYGQRQQGVQMVRIKIPYGKLTTRQLLKIADISDEYATGNLHLTTRQDIQIHYVSLERTPELWAKLEEDDITLREACGNTVRNVTASSIAGIDPNEPFDVSPYAEAVFRYFLRNPVCQEMGRKIKMAFSSSDKDDALTFIHDVGLIPKIKREGNETVRGFKVLVGGGLGSQPFLAKTAHEFLPEDQVIPFIESVLRVFDRYGERAQRNKARLKFLIDKIGFEEFLQLCKEEFKALKNKSVNINSETKEEKPSIQFAETFKEASDKSKYNAWFATNVFEQKQKGNFGVFIKVQLGDVKTGTARALAAIVKNYAADDIRITINQGLLLKFIPTENLETIFEELDSIGLAEPGFNSTADITACPGTDTCNLGISSSTGISIVLEKIIKEEYPDLIYNGDIKIKISGCMNSCGQHGIANIGFHGSSMRAGVNTVPAMLVLLGGGITGNGTGRVSDKLFKVPSKRVPDVLRTLLNDYAQNANEDELFNEYYDRKTEGYFHALLKPLANSKNLTADDFVDWGHEVKFDTAIGVGECAGVIVDLVATLLYEAEEKLNWAKEAVSAGHFADGIYHTYNTMISAAKALLLDKEIHCNTQIGIINDFETHFVEPGLFAFDLSFKERVLRINKEEPTPEFAHAYLSDADDFYFQAKQYREEQLAKVELSEKA
ncbi:MAG: HEPN domain-containing protein [Cyclobacteriaceae bacterium]|nr:HEPN domain-containing protein [Cyclobacteriaceae bacterium]